ncbi:5030_t:CDS:2 [Entrophospora sp. SA101]|nr:5030_t:CDS:2 [Entrophospora sp. SA101]
MSKLLSYFKYNDSERCKLCKTPYQNSGAKWKHSYRSLWNENWNVTEDWVILKQLHHDDEISIQFLDQNLGKDGNKDEYLKQIKEAEEYQRLLMLENNITSYDSMIHNDAIYTSRELKLNLENVWN